MSQGEENVYLDKNVKVVIGKEIFQVFEPNNKKASYVGIPIDDINSAYRQTEKCEDKTGGRTLAEEAKDARSKTTKTPIQITR